MTNLSSSAGRAIGNFVDFGSQRCHHARITHLPKAAHTYRIIAQGIELRVVGNNNCGTSVASDTTTDRADPVIAKCIETAVLCNSNRCALIVGLTEATRADPIVALGVKPGVLRDASRSRVQPRKNRTLFTVTPTSSTNAYMTAPTYALTARS